VILSPLSRRILLGASTLALLAFTLLAHTTAERRRVNFPDVLDSDYLPPTPVLRVASLGHQEAVADLIWIDGLSRYGDQIVHGGDMSWLDSYFDAIVGLDPHFKQAYQWCGVASMYNHDFITNDAVWRSSRCLELGAKEFPDEWMFPFELGSNYLNELKTNDPATRSAWRLKGAGFIEEASVLPGGPPWLASLAAKVDGQEGQEELAIHELEQALALTDDPTERAGLEAQLAKLRPKADVDRLATETAAFNTAWQNTAPYLPPDLFAIVGAPEPAPADLRDLIEDPLERAQENAATPTSGPSGPVPTPASAP
jgi:hypothetical protein